jgi:hypothetical protein
LRDEASHVALEDQLAALKAQAELLAERNVTGELSYFGMPQAELEAMARHCDVRTDYPVRLAEQDVEDLGLDEAERAAWDRAIAGFAAQEQQLYRELLREVAPDTPDLDTLDLASVRKLLTRSVAGARAPEDEELQRAVAEERAGLREPPSDASALSAWNRYNRLRFNAGDRFAALLGDELGDERAEELRRAMGGWPGARTRVIGCPP